MDYHYPPDTLSFRREVRQWLQDNLDDELRGQSNRGSLTVEQLDALRRWNRKLADAGYGIADISRQLQQPSGEIELILALRPKSQ